MSSLLAWREVCCQRFASGWIVLACLASLAVHVSSVYVNITSKTLKKDITKALREKSGEDVTVLLEVLNPNDTFTQEQLEALLNLEGIELGNVYEVRTSGNGSRAAFLCNGSQINVELPATVTLRSVDFHSCSVSLLNNQPNRLTTDTLDVSDVEIRGGHFFLQEVGVKFNGVRFVENASLNVERAGMAQFSNIQVRDVVAPAYALDPAALTFQSCSGLEITDSNFIRNTAPVLRIISCTAPKLTDITVNLTTRRPGFEGTQNQEAAVIIETSSDLSVVRCNFLTNYVLPLKLSEVRTKGAQRPKISGCVFKDNENILVGQSAGLEISNTDSANQQAEQLIVEKSSFANNIAAGPGGAFHLSIVKLISVTIINCAFSQNTARNCSVDTESDLPVSGGALSIQFNQSVVNSEVNVLQSNFSFNRACRGGALSIDFLGSSSNKAQITGCEFNDNRAFNDEKWLLPTSNERLTQQGGAASIIFAQKSHANEVKLQNVSFSTNVAYFGGGLAANFLNNATSNHLQIEGSLGWNGHDDTSQCLFSSNGHREGDKSLSTPDMEFSSIPDLPAQESSTSTGGGVFILDQDGSKDNNMSITGCVFSGNAAFNGGGVLADLSSKHQTTVVSISRSTFDNNRALSGAGISALGRKTASSAESLLFPTLTLLDVNFTDHKAVYRGALSVDSLRLSTQGCLRFFHNNNSAVYLRNSIADHYGTATIENNLGQVGAGLFTLNSQLIVRPGSSILFSNNTALTIGGAIFAHQDKTLSDPHSRSFISDTCFLDYESIRTTDSKWDDFNIIFDSNEAGTAGSAVYMPDISPCAQLGGAALKNGSYPAWMKFSKNSISPGLKKDSFMRGETGGSGLVRAYPPDGDPFWGGLLPHLTETLTHEEQDERTVATDAVRLFFVGDGDKSVGCSELDFVSVYQKNSTVVTPGLPTKLNAVACDQLNNKVDALLYLSVISPSSPWLQRGTEADNIITYLHRLSLVQASEELPIQISSGSYTHLSGSTSSTSEITFTLTEDKENVNVAILAVVMGTAQIVTATVKITVHNCPAGYERYDQNGQFICICKSKDRNPHSAILECDASKDQVVINRGHWGQSRTLLNGKSVLDIAPCPSGYCKTSELHGQGMKVSIIDLSNSNSQCKGNRSGVLCGTCDDGYGASLELWHGRCIDESTCHLSWGAGIVIALCASTVVVFFVLLLDIPLSNDIKGLAFICAVLRMLFQPNDEFISRVNNDDPGTFFGILRILLDLADFSWPVDTCVYKVGNATQAILAGYIIPVYVTFLILFIHLGLSCRCLRLQNCCLFRLFNNKRIANGTFLLAYYVFQHTLELSVLLLQCVHVGDESVFFWNGDHKCFSGLHGLAGALAIVTIFLLGLFILFVWYICKGGEGFRFRPAFLTQCQNDIELIAKDMQLGLKKEYHYWWVFDLMRRVVIMSLFAPLQDDYPIWLKQMLISLACVMFFGVHLFARPYQNAVNDAQAQKNAIFYTMPGILQKYANSCNVIEAVVLADMVLICLLSFSSLTPSANENDHRQYFLCFLVLTPVVSLYLLLFWKIFVIIYRRVNKDSGFCHYHLRHHSNRQNHRQNQRRQAPQKVVRLRDELLPEGELSVSYGSIEVSTLT